MQINDHFRDPLFSTTSAMIMRKNFSYAEKIDVQFMWLEALGLSKVRKSLVRNEGIWAQDSGPCGNAIDSGETCQLSPEASHDYVRSQVRTFYCK